MCVVRHSEPYDIGFAYIAGAQLFSHCKVVGCRLECMVLTLKATAAFAGQGLFIDQGDLHL